MSYINDDEYLPYEEWWEEDSKFQDFCQIDLQQALIKFYENLKSKKHPKQSRREWMETFLLWLEYKK